MSAAADHTILVVDDNADIRDLLVHRLAQEGFRTVTASGGLEALERIAAARPSLILLDINMPEMSGLEVLSRVRETLGPVELPIVMVTAHAESEDVVESLGLGANDHVLEIALNLHPAERFSYSNSLRLHVPTTKDA